MSESRDKYGLGDAVGHLAQIILILVCFSYCMYAADYWTWDPGK